MKILVIDDEVPGVALEGVAHEFGVTIQMARTEREAYGMLTMPHVGGFELILMDGYLEPIRNNPRGTEDLVRWIRRKGYTGPMVAISASDETSQELIAAGCSGAWLKWDVISNLKEWIREQMTKKSS